MTNLSKVPCDCGQQMQEVIWAEKKIRRGWYCARCKAFTKAIYRETKLEEKK